MSDSRLVSLRRARLASVRAVPDDDRPAAPEGDAGSLSVQRQMMPVSRSAGPRVQRVALLRRLESAAEPLMVVVAPSGFGKTCLLEQWAATTGAQVAWLSCDETCGEPTRFWSRLTASLARRWPVMGNDAALTLERPSLG